MEKGKEYAIELLAKCEDMFGNIMASGEGGIDDSLNLKKSKEALEWVRGQKCSNENAALPIDNVSNLLIAFGNELQNIGLTPYDDVKSIVKTYVSDL